jgi:hypothetical protein
VPTSKNLNKKRELQTRGNQQTFPMVKKKKIRHIKHITNKVAHKYHRTTINHKLSLMLSSKLTILSATWFPSIKKKKQKQKFRIEKKKLFQN